MRTRTRKARPNTRRESGHAMSEYIVVSLALLLALVAAVDAVNLLLDHHERASTAMQLPL